MGTVGLNLEERNRDSFRADPECHWVDVPELALRAVLRTKKLSQLKHWQLIEQQINQDGHTKRSGIWRPTERGLQFIRGELAVPHQVYVFNDRKLGHSDKLITVYQALGKRYNYSTEIRKTWIGELG